jgi:proton-coupled amino acid transporter
MIWLSNAHDKVGGTYSEIAEKAMGSFGTYLLDSIIFLTQFGPGVINVGFTVDLLLKSFTIFNVSVSPYIFSVVLLAFLIPLCLIRSIKDQSWAHILADVIIISSILTIAGYSLSQTSSASTSIITPSNMFYTLGTLVYGFEGIPMILPIKEVMNTPKDFNRSLSFMIITIVVVFIFFSNICDFAFGDDIKDLVILNLPNQPWVAVVLIMYSIAVVLTMPLVLNPVFSISEKYLKIKGKKTAIYRIFVILFIVFIGTLARNDLGLYVSIIGGVFSSPLAFIFPAIIHLKMNEDDKRAKIFASVMIGLGVIFGAAAIFSTVYFSF